MSTNELENKLKISKDTAIHCPTLELAKKVLDIFHKLGLKWCNEIYYTKCTNWDSYKENTIYYPFEGRLSSLVYAQEINCEVISAEEFITLHTEEFNLENYEPKGQLIDFPKEIIARILECQEEQGNKRDVTVFEKSKFSPLEVGGFAWNRTKEKDVFWYEVISYKNFDLFFERYPKKEDNQEFKVGDKVIYFITNKIGTVKEVKKHKFDNYIDIIVDYGNNDVCEYEIGSEIKRPFLLHYRDDYNYDIIDFNNLPQRQEVKRWRAKKGELYYLIHLEDMGFCRGANLDKYNEDINEYYEYGNYFKTEEEAQEIADQMNTYFQKIVKI